MERVRHLVSNNEVSNLSSINVPQQLVANSITDLSTCDPPVHQLSKMRLRVDEATEVRDSCISAREPLKSWNAETELTLEDASLVVIEDVLETGSHKSGPTNFSSSHNESDKTASETDGGEHEKESENDSIAYTSMEKEFRKLIQDNKDLLNTKNALNVVKDDLIAEVDRLTNEVTMYEQAVEQLNSTKEQMKHKVSTVDAELRKTKEELEKAKQKIREVSWILSSHVVTNVSHIDSDPNSYHPCRIMKKVCHTPKENDSAEPRWPKFSWNAMNTRRNIWNCRMPLDILNWSVQTSLKAKNDLVYGNC